MPPMKPRPAAMGAAGKPAPKTETPKGRSNRIMQILDAMSQDERADFFEEVGETYCTACGEELPDEDSNEPDHDCPEEEDDDGGDEESDEEGPEEDEDEEEDADANEP